MPKLEDAMPRITRTDKKLIDEWLTEMSTDPIKAFSSRTGDETRLMATITKQLIEEQREDLNDWIAVYTQS